MTHQEEDVYCTLLLNDKYLPGAQVLAHSLRDGGTKKRLAVLVLLSGVSKETVAALKRLYDYVIPVEPVYSRSAVGLDLMQRPDLGAALTKIALWKQTQFRKIVYVDADIVALRAPDELFDVKADFAAAPDVGWPDCFNSGLMVLKPDPGTYEQLAKLAAEGQSFDGADQGLLNQHFADWHRLSFTYNCTVGLNMSYQYAPAYSHYGKNVSLVHFIGAQKPWDRGFIPGYTSTTPYEKLNGHWWDVWNKHLGPYAQRGGSTYAGGAFNYVGSSTSHDVGTGAEGGKTGFVGPSGSGRSFSPPQGHSRGYSLDDAPEFRRAPLKIHPSHNTKFVPIRSIKQTSPRASPTQEATPQVATQPILTHHEQYVVQGKIDEQVETDEGPIAQEHFFQTGPGRYHIYEHKPGDNRPVPLAFDNDLQGPSSTRFSAPQYMWDPTRSAPPMGSAPEAPKLEIRPYVNEWDNTSQGSSERFVAPSVAPPPKQHIWYEIPEATPEPGRTLFPWETKARQVTRVFHDTIPGPPREDSSEPEHVSEEEPVVAPVPVKAVFPWEDKPRTVTRVFSSGDSPVMRPESLTDDDTNTNDDDLPSSLADSEGSGSWTGFGSRENKWDTDPAIRDYVLGLRRRKGQAPSEIPVLSGGLDEVPPVTPAPIRRVAPTWVADEAEMDEEDAEWDPEKKLEELRRLPPSFVAQFVARSMKNTDAPSLEDKAIQAKNENVPPGEVQIVDDDDTSLTPKTSGLDYAQLSQ